ncbi:hypothetical protein CSB45_04245 [candidate division KSB3 bacterium]|uniref:Uncharacterized protein n=1 Tax=candidate division KSB3 bacterium TaxID=2044937 RepID=A0A2G6E8B4_9BACT|nr:MAG: hypothetical protein CSB45_04245 [candidate division KSB3 bacterium]PIE30589.1 MAG: hypothetical protein CSA57_02830 [candidate division KSB3 bacterium]
MMTFGQYIRFRREKILQRERLEIDFGNSYLASIETEERRPTKPEVIKRLGKALGILDPTAQEWMWYYSMSNKEPYPFPAMYKKPIVTKDDLPSIFHDSATSPSDGSKPVSVAADPSSQHNTEITLQPNGTEEDVLAILGSPDKKIRVPTRCKWIYEKEGLHIIFSDNKVIDIAFK